MTRHTGKTKALVMSLPASPARPIVIIHDAAFEPYLRNMLRDLRPDVDAQIVAIDVAGQHGRLLQISNDRPLFVDHAFWQLARLECTSSVRAMIEGRLNA